MPIITRKRTIRGAVRDVVIAPLVLVLAMIAMHWKWLLLSLVLAVLSTWLAGQPLAQLLPGRETLVSALFFIAFVAAAAIPLAIRDYFSHGGYERVWVRSAETTATARRLAVLLCARNYAAYYEHFAPLLQTRLTLDAFADDMKSLTQVAGPLIAIEAATELEFAAAQPLDSPQPPAFDAIVQVTFAHTLGRKSQLTLYLMSEKAQVMDFRHELCES